MKINPNPPKTKFKIAKTVMLFGRNVFIIYLVMSSGLTSKAQPQPPATGPALGMMMFKFHARVKTERAVAVGCSDLLGIVNSSKPLSLATNGNPVTPNPVEMNMLDALPLKQRIPVHDRNGIGVQAKNLVTM